MIPAFRRAATMSLRSISSTPSGLTAMLPHIPPVTALTHYTPPMTALMHYTPPMTALMRYTPRVTALTRPTPPVTALARRTPPVTALARYTPRVTALTRPTPVTALTHPTPPPVTASPSTPEPVPKPTRKRVAAALGRNVFSQVTPSANVSGIMEHGLLASRGGKGGAGAAVGDERFMEHSTGLVHLGSTNPLLGEKDPARFYERVFRSSGVPSTTLNVAPSAAIRKSLRHDPDDTQGGRFNTHKDIPRSSIVPMPLKTAIRKAGVIGADYAPHDFVNHALGRVGHGRSQVQRVEDLRRAIHNSNATMYDHE